jgi:hypothetical protein
MFQNICGDIFIAASVLSADVPLSISAPNIPTLHLHFYREHGAS